MKQFQTYFIALFLGLILIGSQGCGEKNDPETWCGFGNAREITWLGNQISQWEKSTSAPGVTVYGYIYKGDDVFEINDCVGCSDALIVVYDCAGEKICEFGGIAGLNTCPNFYDRASNRTLIWSN